MFVTVFPNVSESIVAFWNAFAPMLCEFIVIDGMVAFLKEELPILTSTVNPLLNVARSNALVPVLETVEGITNAIPKVA